MTTVTLMARLLRNAKILNGTFMATARASFKYEALSLAGKATKAGRPHTVVLLSWLVILIM